MEARVKATGKIVEVVGEGIQNSNMVMTAHGEWFTKDELDIVPLSWKPFEPTYWQKLEHTYAGMAMQGILANIDLLMSLGKKKTNDYPVKYTVTEFAKDCAHALVEKYKKEEK